MEKMAQICQISRKKKKKKKRVSKSPNFYDKVPVGSQEYRKILGFFKKNFFLLSYLVCSQIWLNHLMDDHHFSYMTKLGGKKKHCLQLALSGTKVADSA
jgi:hypothetical protein